MEALYPLALEPCCRDYLWGGQRLTALYGKGRALPRTAESWELSCLQEGPSTVLNGVHAGKNLSEALGGAQLPVLVKLLNAAQPLSIQVHPSDETADAARGERGKAELWYIVDCEPESWLYYGLSRPVSARALRESTQDGTILSLLNRVSVKRGDIFFVRPGTIHGLGPGLVVAELQQSSDTTFRLYDFGRLGPDGQPRALHVERGCAVADRAALPAAPCAPLGQTRGAGWLRTELFACPYFRAALLDVTDAAAVDARGGFAHLLFLEGRGELVWQDQKMPFSPGASWFLPAGLGEVRVEGACRALLTRE